MKIIIIICFIMYSSLIYAQSTNGLVNGILNENVRPDVMSVEEFKSTKPETPEYFSVIAKLDDYYNYGFGSDIYISVSIKFLNKDEIGHGYVVKNQVEGAALLRALKDGKAHLIIVGLKFTKTTFSLSLSGKKVYKKIVKDVPSNHFLITDFSVDKEYSKTKEAIKQNALNKLSNEEKDVLGLK